MAKLAEAVAAARLEALGFTVEREVFGVPVQTQGVPLCTGARHYAEAGVPTVLYGAGPRSILEAGAHGADENLVLDDLHRAMLMVARVLAGLLA
jgi:acetylornithine deacetylase/succinyl-diaminopimelate desuccinylase-like protein